MKTYEDDVRAIKQFIKESGMSLCTLARVSKKLCVCGACKHFVRHYTNVGEELKFGHCKHGTVLHSKMTYNSACGNWEYGREPDEED